MNEKRDNIAEEVMRISEAGHIGKGVLKHKESINRKCGACKMEEIPEEENMIIKRKSATTSKSNDDIINESINLIPVNGSSLDSTTKNFMEYRFGYDFSHVRIHSDKQAAESAGALNALAYTVGKDIMFAKEQYNPHKLSSKKLLAHELTHVIQQNQNNLIHSNHLTNSRELSENTNNKKEIGKGIPTVNIQKNIPLTIARAPNPQQPLQSPLTVEEIFEIIVKERAFTFNKGGPPVTDPGMKGKGAGPAAGGRHAGESVFAVVQLTDRQGNRIDLSKGTYLSSKDKHAEPAAIKALENTIKGRTDIYGGKMTVVLDQFPCPPGNKDCIGTLRKAAFDNGVGLQVYVPERENVTKPGEMVKPKTAARGSQRTDFPPVRLRRLDELYIPSPPTGGPPSQSTPSGTTGGKINVSTGKPPSTTKSPPTTTPPTTAPTKSPPTTTPPTTAPTKSPPTTTPPTTAPTKSPPTTTPPLKGSAIFQINCDKC